MKFFLIRFFKNQASLVPFEKGFSLIEAMIAIFVIVVGIVAILQMFPLSIQQQSMGERATVATELGQGKIEELISGSYDNILVGMATENYGTISGFNAYKRVTFITCVNPSFGNVACNYNLSGDPEPLIKIEVTVFWKSSLGTVEKNLKITTVIAKR